MTERPEIPTGASLDLVNIALNTQALCLQHALRHIADAESPQDAAAFKQELIEGLRSGSIDMALLEDTAIFDFVVGTVEQLAIPTEPNLPVWSK
ncbi:MAG: hypothetical protein ACTHOP_10740 [Mesorhizobium sp.]